MRERLGDREILGLTLGLEHDGDDLHPWEARERLRETWVAFLEELASDEGATVLIEDAHWADEALLELLDRAAGDVRGPLLLLVTARPELVGRSPEWGAARRNASRLWLEPLETADAVRMLEQLAGHLPLPVRDLVVERAGGNPFFVEEVLQSLLDQGLLRRENAGWTASALPARPQIADSVHAVIAARIDLLPSVEKHALQAAAVIGNPFWASAVQAVAEAGSADLRLLEERDFISRGAKGPLAGEQEYHFKHALTRDVAYGSLPAPRCARLHAAFAEWLEGTESTGDEHAPLLAHHYAEAVAPERAELAWPDQAERVSGLKATAVRWLRRASDLAAERYEIEDALALLDHARAFEADDAARAELWRASARVNRLRWDADAFRGALEQALALLPPGPAAGRVYAELAYDGAQPYLWKTPPTRAVVQRWIARALELAGADEAPRAKALIARAVADPAQGASAAREGMAIAEKLGNTGLLTISYEARATVATAAGRLDEAGAWADRIMALNPSIGDPDTRGAQDFHVAFVYLRLGRIDDARRIADEHHALSARLTPHHEVHALALRLIVELVSGRWGAAAELTAQVEAASAANRETPCQFNWRSLLMSALAHASLHEDEQARRLEKRAAGTLSVGGPLGREPALLRIALARDDLEAAERLLREDPGPDVWDVDHGAARLDAHVALRDRDDVEAEAPPALALGGYVEPFALRALGSVREDAALIERAETRFRALGLSWRAVETHALL